MNIWEISFFGLLLTLDLEKGSSLQASYSNAFAKVVDGAGGTMSGRITQLLP